MPPDALDPHVDHAPVSLDLGFTGAADESQTAALTLEVGPTAHEAAFLVQQMGEFDLQRALARLGTLTEDFEDQAGAVENLDRQFLLEIALLNRAETAIHDEKLDLFIMNQIFEFFQLSRPEQRAGPHDGDDVNPAVDNIEIEGRRQPGDLIQTRLRGPIGSALGLDVGVNDQCSRCHEPAASS